MRLKYPSASLGTTAMSHADAPTPAQIRAQGNRLQHEPSLYLQQHAHNPVDWRPWGAEALEAARARNLPLFVSSGYSSCHWCHVMEREVFEHDDVAEVLNAQFICIKVDREERPDLDAALMDALTAMTGGGGWPLSLFLTPDLRPFYGATYIPHERFLAITSEISRLHLAEPQRLQAIGAELLALTAREPQPAQAAALDSAFLAQLAESALQVEDTAQGGFATQMKFPTPPRWRFLLRRYRRTGEARLGAMLSRVLDAMAQGGIRDQLGGGFHRYTVEPTWTVPHFEKMLYDNTQLASLYLEAGAALGRADYTAVGLDTLDFLLREMRGPGAAFYASFDADSGGEEGSYYVWTPRELEAAVGPADAPALALLLGVTAGGNFEGASIPTRRVTCAQVAQATGRSAQEIERLYSIRRADLREFRAKRTPPALDRKIVTAWNGMAIAALAQAYLASGEQRYLTAAQQAADYLWQHHRNADGGLWRASTDSVRAGAGVLSDYAQFALGLIELYCAGGDILQLRHAVALLDYALAHFERGAGGYYLAADDADAPLGRQADLFDSVEPSGSAALLHALWRSAALTGREEYRAAVQRHLQACSGLIRQGGLELAAWCELAEYASGPYYTTVLAGEAQGATQQALLREYGALLPGHSVLAQIPAAGAQPDDLALIPEAQGKTAPDESAQAYICEHGTCYPPCATADALRAQLLRGWHC